MSSEQLSVLIVDDEKSVRQVVSRMLGDRYIVLEAMDGEEALDMAHRHQPDIILMDIMMSKMDGYIACSKIKNDQATKHIPVVMVTAVGQGLNKKLAYTMGAEGYITKPFTKQDLLDEISRLVETPE